MDPAKKQILSSNRHRCETECHPVAEDTIRTLQKEVETLPSDAQQPITSIWSLFSSIPSNQRELVLHGIFARCCLPELSHAFDLLKRLLRIDPLAALPREMAYKVLSYLDAGSLSKAAQVSRLWRSLADDDIVWRKMCKQHINRKCSMCGWGLPLLHRRSPLKSKARTTKTQQDTGTTSSASLILPAEPGLPTITLDDGESPSTPPKKRRRLSESEDSGADRLMPSRPWKDVYKEGFKIGLNWKYGRCKVTVFTGHSDSIMCLQINGNTLATGSYDTTIKIWDIQTSDLLRTLKGHRAGVRTLQFDGDRLISGSMDKTLKVWNWRTGQCMCTLTGHEDSVIDLHCSGKAIASASSDKTVKVWRLDGRDNFTLRGHEDWVNAVQLDLTSRTLLSASDDMTIRLWDLDTRQCIKVFKGHCAQVQQALFLPREVDYKGGLELSSKLNAPSQGPIREEANPCARQSLGFGFSATPDRALPPRHILSSGLDNTIRLWDVTTGQCLRELFGHVEGVWALAADKLRIVSGAGDSKAKVWDLTSGLCEWTFTGHSKSVTCITLNESMMCTGSDDCQARLYNFKVDG